jgi:rhodanese-related sulfurtransferase
MLTRTKSNRNNAQPRQLHYSAVLQTPAADPEEARAHFAGRLIFETDTADLMMDLDKGNTDLVVVDTRSAKSFEQCHIPGAINLPQIDAGTTSELSKEKVYVVYCWGIGCNGSTKAAMRLNELGFRAKELIGGIEYWRKEGGLVEGTLGSEAPCITTIVPREQASMAESRCRPSWHCRHSAVPSGSGGDIPRSSYLGSCNTRRSWVRPVKITSSSRGHLPILFGCSQH